MGIDQGTTDDGSCNSEENNQRNYMITGGYSRSTTGSSTKSSVTSSTTMRSVESYVDVSKMQGRCVDTLNPNVHDYNIASLEEKYPAKLYGTRQNVIINYLPSTFMEGDLRELFLPYGLLKHVKIARWPTGCSKEFGFVKFAKSSQAFRAVAAVNGLWIDSKRLKVSLARKHCKEIRNTHLIVKHIPAHYNNRRLSDMFAAYGTLLECRILRKKNHRRMLQDGMVRFDCSRNAMRAIKALNGVCLDDGQRRLEVRLMKKRRDISRDLTK